MIHWTIQPTIHQIIQQKGSLVLEERALLLLKVPLKCFSIQKDRLDYPSRRGEKLFRQGLSQIGHLDGSFSGLSKRVLNPGLLGYWGSLRAGLEWLTYCRLEEFLLPRRGILKIFFCICTKFSSQFLRKMTFKAWEGMISLCISDKIANPTPTLFLGWNKLMK